MLIWRGLKPTAIVAAMLAVQSEWKRTSEPRSRQDAARRRADPTGNPARAARDVSFGTVSEAPQASQSTAVPRLVVLDGAAAKPGRPIP